MIGFCTHSLQAADRDNSAIIEMPEKVIPGFSRFSPFSNFGTNVLNSFVGYTTFFHLAAFATTAVLVEENVDYLLYKRLNGYARYQPYFIPSLYIGTGFWLMAAAPLFFHGFFGKDIKSLGASYAVLQSTVISILYATLLKSITGRPPPDGRWYTDMKHKSKRFRFGFLRGGIFFGWPSGHVLITTATISSLLWYYPEHWWIAIPGAILIAYTMVGVTIHNGHWFSDSPAALLMGYAIGSTVGKSFRNMVRKYTGEAVEGSVDIVPCFSTESLSLGVVMYF